MEEGLDSLRVDPYGRNGRREAAYFRVENYISFGSGSSFYVHTAEDADIIWLFGMNMLMQSRGIWEMVVH
jgi:hypothetical protein